MKRTVGGILAIGAIVTLTSVTASFGQAKEKSLYDRLGGKSAITAVVDEFVARCAADKRISHFFGPTASDPERLKKFKGNLVDQICEAGGGPALDKFKVGAKEKDQLLAVLGPMKSDIVEKK